VKPPAVTYHSHRRLPLLPARPCSVSFLIVSIAELLCFFRVFCCFPLFLSKFVVFVVFSCFVCNASGLGEL
jgi:hypothetical protein